MYTLIHKYKYIHVYINIYMWKCGQPHLIVFVAGQFFKNNTVSNMFLFMYVYIYIYIHLLLVFTRIYIRCPIELPAPAR